MAFRVGGGVTRSSGAGTPTRGLGAGPVRRLRDGKRSRPGRGKRLRAAASPTWAEPRLPVAGRLAFTAGFSVDDATRAVVPRNGPGRIPCSPDRWSTPRRVPRTVLADPPQAHTRRTFRMSVSCSSPRSGDRGRDRRGELRDSRDRGPRHPPPPCIGSPARRSTGRREGEPRLSVDRRVGVRAGVVRGPRDPVPTLWSCDGGSSNVSPQALQTQVGLFVSRDRVWLESQAGQASMRVALCFFSSTRLS